MSAIRNYLARTIPWSEDGTGYCNIHYTFKPRDGKLRNGKYPWTGRAARNLDEAVRAVEFAINSADVLDIYACMSTQSRATEKTSARGFKYYTPLRAAENAIALKSFFIDIDIKEGPKGYATIQELVIALDKFIKAVGLPTPSQIVKSGGGMHIYWIVDRALTPHEWQPYANALAESTRQHGLKCDTQCTVDSARVLRVPGTKNTKTEPYRDVELTAAGTDFDYSFERIASSLEPYKGRVPTLVGGVDSTLFPQRAPAQASDLAANYRADYPRVDLDLVLPECPWILDALNTHGAAHDNPQWNLTTLCSVFSKQGAHAAHMMASGHPDYSHASTQDLYERKEREVEGGLGWPSCSAIANAGSSFCATCPNFAKGKSPLNHERRPAPQPTGAVAQLIASAPQATQPGTTQNALGATPVNINDLPPGYTRNAAGIVSIVVVDDDGNQSFKPVSAYPMINGMLRNDKSRALLFDTEVEQTGLQRITLETAAVNTMTMRTRLQEQGFMLAHGTDKTIGEFFVAWIKHLQKNAIAVKGVAFGWEYDKRTGKVEGFAYGGQLWTANGPIVTAAPGYVTAGHYQPCGTIEPWKEALKLVSGCGRPDLEIIVASAFAAPLVHFTGHQGALLSAYSTESGIGKTTASELAQAVWGHPKHKMGLSDTPKSAMNKMGELRSLPLYWDEIKSKADTEAFVKLTFQITQGRENARLTSNIQQREPGEWQTLVVSTSNESLIDYITAGTRTTTAGIMRVLEYKVKPSVSGKINSATAQSTLSKIFHNFGNAGMIYAQWLGQNHARVRADMDKLAPALTTQLNSPTEERFWIGCIASVLLGASYSNMLGLTNFDVTAMKIRLVEVLNAMRKVQVEQPVDLTNSVNVSSILSDFITAHHDAMMLTNVMHLGKGRPAANSVQVIRPPNNNKGVIIHVAKDKSLRISQSAFYEYLRKRNLSTTAVWSALERQFGAIRSTGNLGAGTVFATMTIHTVQMNMAGHPDLDFVDLM